TGECELASEVAARVLVDHAANSVGVIAGEDPVDHHLCDRHLSADGLASSFEVDCVGKTLLLFHACRAEQVEAFGWTLLSMVLTGHLTFGRYGLIARHF